MNPHSGIFTITHEPSGCVFVGGSVNVPASVLAHTQHLINGTHSNRRMQDAWNQDGSAAFAFRFIEHCDAATLENYRRFYLETFAKEPGGLFDDL